MIKEEGKLKYKDKSGLIIETPIIEMNPFYSFIDILTIQGSQFVKYCYYFEKDEWYKYKPDPEDEDNMIVEPCQEEIVDFYFTTRLVKNEGN